MQGLLSDRKTADETLGFLLSFALYDFSVSGIFTSFRSTEYADLDATLNEFGPRLGLIHQSGAIKLLWCLGFDLSTKDTSMRHGFYRLFECLSRRGHRNQAIFCSAGFVKLLFDSICSSRVDETFAENDRHVLQKLLRTLLEVGTTTGEAREIFQRVVTEDDTLDTEILEIVRGGIKSRWMEHFSMESRAALTLTQENIKGMPQTGFTYMVSKSINSLSYPDRFYLDLDMDQRAALRHLAQYFWISPFFPFMSHPERSKRWET